MSIGNAMLLRFASGVRYGFRDRQRFELVPKMTINNKNVQSERSAVRSKLFSHEYENNTNEAEQALPAAWRGAGRSSRGTRPLLSSSDGARSCRNRPRCLMMLHSSKKQKKNKNNQHQVSPFFSKLNIFREGLVSAKGE